MIKRTVGVELCLGAGSARKSKSGHLQKEFVRCLWADGPNAWQGGAVHLKQARLLLRWSLNLALSVPHLIKKKSRKFDMTWPTQKCSGCCEPAPVAEGVWMLLFLGLAVKRQTSEQWLLTGGILVTTLSLVVCCVCHHILIFSVEVLVNWENVKLIFKVILGISPQ